MKRILHDIKFKLKAHYVVIILAILGVMCIVISNIISADIISNIINTIGQTLVASVCISLLLEISTLNRQITNAIVAAQKTLYKSIFGKNNEFIKYIPEESIEKLRMEIASALIKSKSKISLPSREVGNTALDTYEKRIIESLCEGIICESLERNIKIIPNEKVKQPEFQVEITEVHQLRILCSCEQRPFIFREHRYIFISDKQNQSFSLVSLILNGSEYKDKCSVIKITPESYMNKAEVGDRAFVYMTKIEIPQDIICENTKKTSQIKYTLKYKYTNYEQSMYLTNALNYLTKKVSERYTLNGRFANGYIIHGFTHYPYHNTQQEKVVFKKPSPAIIEYQTQTWQLPGSGVSVVVRKKNCFTEDII